jgi:ferredoxin-NADP reductase/MOSC domain-containing protein YiiM
MKVISVNVGQPREIEWNGQMIRTSIFKTPVKGPVRVRQFNIDGDAQSDLVGHGGEHRAVMVYQADSYQFWRKQFQRDDWAYGRFGENLTVEGLADKDVCIGDRFQIGTAIFEVTQPRVTCYKIGISTGVPEMPALLVALKRPGFYFRVIKEGIIGAGDLILQIAKGPESMSVVDVDQLLYSKDHSEEGLKKALKIPALSKGWRTSFQELLHAVLEGVNSGNAGLTGIQSRPAAWFGFRPFVIRSSRMESNGVRSFELEPANKGPLPEFIPGQHIAIRIPAAPNVIPLLRMYSLCGPPGTTTYRIAVKREIDGRGSIYLHEQINNGDILEVSAPRGTFTLSSGKTPLVLLSAGVGITPLLGILYAVGLNSVSREVWWIHSTQNGAHYSFANEVKKIGTDLANFHMVRIYSRPSENEQQGMDYDIQGRLNLELLKKLKIPLQSEWYLCGPEGYLSDTRAALRSLGIPEGNIRYEDFGNHSVNAPNSTTAPHLPFDNAGTGPLVTFAKSKISFPWNSHFRNLLEAAEACDVPVLWSCRTGVCHRCESGIIDGKVAYSPDPLDPPAEGNVLICCAAPVAPLELDL